MFQRTSLPSCGKKAGPPGRYAALLLCLLALPPDSFEQIGPKTRSSGSRPEFKGLKQMTDP